MMAVKKGKPTRKVVLVKIKARSANAREVGIAENSLPEHSDKHAVFEES